MKQIFGKGALQIVPASGGFVFVAQQNTFDDKAVVVYRMFECENSVMTAVTRNVFLLSKFGNNFPRFENKPSDFLSCKTAFLPEHRVLSVSGKGDAEIIALDGSVVWKGKMLYKNQPPEALCPGERCVWASFKNANAVVRYSLRTMREELRIGGVGKTIDAPQGLYLQDDRLLVCASGAKSILEIDLATYVVKDYQAFDEPVHDYIKINSSEIVLLDSGIYKF